MAIDPILIHTGVFNRDPDSEEELVIFLKHLVWQDYKQTLGPLAEDYLQELCVRVTEAIRAGKLNDPQKLIPYCQETAKNVRIDGLRLAVRQAAKLVAIDEARFQHSGDDAEADLIQAEQLAQQFRTVLKLMERLDPFSREVVRRYYFERQTVPEIATEFARPAPVIQRVKDRAVEKLRRDYRMLSVGTDAQGWSVLRGKGKPAGESVFALAA